MFSPSSGGGTAQVVKLVDLNPFVFCYHTSKYKGALILTTSSNFIIIINMYLTISKLNTLMKCFAVLVKIVTFFFLFFSLG